MLPRLPTIDPPAAGETLLGYGCKVIAFVHATGCTATLSDRDLELADYAYPVAIGAPDVLPGAVDRLSAARRLILDALKRRQQLATEAAAVPAVQPDASLAGGHLVPLLPRPQTQPPSAEAINRATRDLVQAVGRKPDIRF